MSLVPFDLARVRLLDGPCLAMQEANRRYLHSLDEDRLLHCFRTQAGLPAPGEPLGGWEAPTVEVRGHFMGHFLSACAMMSAAAGDEELGAKADRLVAELARCQAANGGGYLMAFPESHWDRLEAMQNVPWAAFYVVHKLLAGLLDVHHYRGNQQALEVAVELAGYFGRRFEQLDIRNIDQLLQVEQGGMSDALHNLYATTGDEVHLAHAHQHDRASLLGPLAIEHDSLSLIHANTQIPEVIGAARRYELTGDARFRTAAEYFWQRIVSERSYCTGGSTSGEVWPLPGHLAGTLGTTNQETCTTYNMLKLTRHLLAWDPQARYGDFYELALFNGILGTQNPDGMLLYYLPLESGHRKSWGTALDSFWCCTGTGVENFSKLGDSIWFHDATGVWLNLFIASTVDWTERGVRLEQQTRFPDEPRTTVTVRADAPTRFTLHLRIPAWAAGDVALTVNGEAVAAEPGTWCGLEREWRDGDRVELTVPMALEPVPMPDDPELLGVRYGPIVLAGLTDRHHLILADPADPTSWLEPVPGDSLAFRTKGIEPVVDLIPLHRIVDEAYAVYWTVTPAGSPTHQAHLAEEAAAAARRARIIDEAIPNNAESEQAHAVTGERTGSGPLNRRGWRHATDGGWFSYRLRVTPDAPVILSLTYWGSDAGARTFDVLVDGELVETRTLSNTLPGKFFEVEIPLSTELTRGKEQITVRFQAHPGNFAGGVFGVATMRAE